MSFQNKGFWMPRDAGCIAEESGGYENSPRVEPKRSHQWLTDTGEPEIFSNKKQAIEASSSDMPVSTTNASHWDTSSGFHSVTGQFSDRLFGSDLIRSVNSVDNNMSSTGSGNLNIGGRQSFGNQYGNDPSVRLSVSPTMLGPSPCLNFGGIRKVKVNQVRDSDHGMPADNNTFSIDSGYDKNDGNITSGPSYSNGSDNADNTVVIGISKPGDNLLAMGHIFNKGDGNFMLMGNNYGKGDENILSTGRPVERGDGNFITMNQSFGKEDGNLISLGTSYSKEHESFPSMVLTSGNSGENFTTVAPSYDNGADHLSSIGPAYVNVDSNVASTSPSFDSNNPSFLPASQNLGNTSTASFGGFHAGPEPNPSGGVFSGFDPLMGNQNSAQGAAFQRGQIESNPDPLVNNISKSKNNTIVKNKEPKTAKKASNNFPSNVKSLLSTGIFDGISVKYCTWSRERNLQGIIKGTGYMCSCDDCKGQKALNAYEFERHAGAKSKHPNNHIFFENGKSIYAVVQELKNTPQEMLFDAIQTVTGSTINQKNFRFWKASYQAATRELQRIYGRDDAVIPS
ncbi:uncharacterized protein LOC131635797 [Vicia villosa]|uniref:uncharacterized protein LOC131635797 n=1 Tax=Vicia villosa TaxID=3911 RepID=UPI00273B6B0F|nr:uncharacterized protein LOC131635797 [Vicia villosa]